MRNPRPHRFSWRGAVAVVLAAFTVARGDDVGGQRPAESVAFVNVTVIDGTGALKRNQTVLTSGGRIAAVADASRLPTPPGARTIDGAGKYLIPGLWDLHVHTRYEGIDHLRLFIANGVTGVRDMGGPWDHMEVMKRWRREIEAGKRVGPRIALAGPLLDAPGSPWSHAHIVDGPDAGRTVVKRLRSSGADFVKIYDLLTHESVLAIVDEAKRQGLPIAGHVPFVMGIREVSDVGFKTVEHLGHVLLACSSREEEILARVRTVATTEARRGVMRSSRTAILDSFDRSRATGLAAVLRRNKTSLVPALSNSWTALADSRKDGQIGQRLRYVPAAYRAEWRGDGLGAAAAAEFRDSLKVVRVLHEAGVEFVTGTDVVKAQLLPGFSLHDELSLFVAAGLTPMEALEAATRKPARLLGHTDVGTVEPGMQADLVLLDADPLEDIENSRRIASVMTAGRLFDRQALDTMLDDIEREAARWNGTPTR